MSEQEHRSASPQGWLAWIESHVWAMEPQALATLCRQAADERFVALLDQFAESRAEEREQRIVAETVDRLRALDALGDLSPSAFRAIEGAVEAARGPGRPKAISGGVATVKLKGVLAPPPAFLAWLFDLEHPLVAFERNLKTALADPDVGAVVVEVDSPGGQVDGIPEAAAMMRQVRGPKPIVAVANTMAASAAYWLAAQADEISVTPSGAVGSIGVYATHLDQSGAMKLLGVDVSLISAGKYKTEGNPWQPLSDDAREHIQEDVDHFYGLFTADVAKGRGAKQSDVRSGYGEGRVLNAKTALSEGLVDRIETLGEAASRLSARRSGATATTRAEAEPEPTTVSAEEQDSGAMDVDEARDSVLAALADEVDPVLADRAFDKIGALNTTTTS